MEEVITWIKKERNKGKSWEEILFASQSTDDGLRAFLQSASTFFHWPQLSVEDWKNIVKSQQEDEAVRNRLIDEQGSTVIGAVNEDNEISIPENEDSAWQSYKRKLIRDGFNKNTIDLMEDATLKTLRHLSRDTRNIESVKGLVVGNVQSGKTANMAALIAMAADNGWNMFVILSGMMNNLRIQTQKRLWNDLSSGECKWDWHIIDNPRPVEEAGRKLRDLQLSTESRRRYIAVCLKNSTPLSNIIDWLAYDKASRENVRMLIIDDEADQASINTSQDDRTTINKLILNLINNRDSKSRNISSKIQGINYIGYTATPYANVLNESPGKESLYPSNFLTSLSTSNEYFGPQQIFGYDDGDSTTYYEGLDIIRNVSDSDVREISELHDGSDVNLPASLRDSISWFICSVGYMRYINYNKPISMLIHTSRNVPHHNNIADAVSRWINRCGSKAIIEICEQLWEEETSRFTLEDFKHSYPKYGAEVRDYPEFNAIRPYVEGLLNVGLTRIQINSDNSALTYSSGIHLCIDNSERNFDADTIKRLVYPDKDEMPDLAPAFLVVGGNTLSRGLTIEGLVSTFFLRPANCADTLMQMGRWFGYRRGYELIPRIWMTIRTKEQYGFIAEMDQKLRDEIKEMSTLGMSPRECGPKIMTSPATVSLQIVSNNKRQQATNAEYDFAGHTMETGVFNNNLQQLKYNMRVSSDFLDSLGSPSTDVMLNPNAKNNTVWKNVSIDSIVSFLKQYSYSERLRGFNESDAFIGWLNNATNEGLLKKWNIILAGINRNSDTRIWQVNGEVSTAMVNRTRKYVSGNDDIINIGTLRSFNDFLSDIPIHSLADPNLSHMQDVGHNLTALNQLRERLGLGNTPQLIIYVIDRNSKPERKSKRFPLNAVHDIAGFSINIPGFRRRNSVVQSICIRIPDLADIEE